MYLPMIQFRLVRKRLTDAAAEARREWLKVEMVWERR
jgi:hypothetical protein